MSRLLLTFLFSISLIVPLIVSSSASEIIPDDIRYLLEEMYGADKKEWPAPRYKTDLNKDGFEDWVAVKKGCALKELCPAEFFICMPNKKGMCSDYCYFEVKTLKNVEKNIKNRKCESTC